MPPENPAPASNLGSAARTRGFARSELSGTEGARTIAPPATAGNAASRPTAIPAAPGMPARATPMPKRPKGRLFVGAILLAIFGGGGYLIWNSLLRYDAYGAITGRVVQVPASQGGIIHALHVRERDKVQQGQLLLTLENIDLNQRLSRLGDDLRMAQANLDAEISKLQWQAQQQGDQTQRAAADYFELWGDLVQQQAKLAELQARLDRDRAFVNRGALAYEQQEETEFAVVGQRAKIEKLTEAAAERKKLTELSVAETSSAQLKPLLVRIEVLQAEIARLRELVQQGQIRAPVSGRVVRLPHFTGEQVAAAQVVLEILDAGSVEALLYLPQGRAARLQKSQELTLQIDPLGGQVTGNVRRFGEQFITVPEALQRHYLKYQQVLPVYVQLQLLPADQERLKLGSEVRLPTAWTERLLLQQPQVPPTDTARAPWESLPTSHSLTRKVTLQP